MSEDNHGVDGMLRENAEGQLADFEWDRLQTTILSRLEGARRRARQREEVSRKIVAGGIVTAAAAVVLGTGYVCTRFYGVASRGPGTPTKPTAAHDLADSDELLASTDPETILLTGRIGLLALNDPLLAPHSVWDQQPLEESDDDPIAEKRHGEDET
jgi:hypothetical protein